MDSVGVAPFAIRVEDRQDGYRMYACCRYEVTFEQLRHVVRMRLYGVVGHDDVAGIEVLLTSGATAYVMNGRGDTVDSVRTVKRQAVSA